MPRVPILPENKTGPGSQELFPTLKFTRVGERQRLLCLETTKLADGRRMVAPVGVRVHYFKAPEVLDGEGLKEQRERRDGTKELVWKLDFLGQTICLGNPQVLEQRGTDPDHCPACKANLDYPEWFKPAEMYYAMNVLLYSTRPGGWELAKPFSVSVIAWKLTSRRFNDLADLQADLANGTVRHWSGRDVPKDLSLVDLRLGPAEDPVSYQKYKVQSAEGIAMARSSQQVEQYILKNVWTPDNLASEDQLEAICGRRTELGYVQADIAKTLDRWRVATRSGPATPDALGPLGGANGAADMQGGLDALLADAEAPPPDAPSPALGADPALDLPVPPSAAELEAAAGPGGLDQFTPSPDVTTAAPSSTVTAAGPDVPEVLGTPEPSSAGQTQDGVPSFEDLMTDFPTA